MSLPADVQLITEPERLRLVLPVRPKSSRAGGCAAIAFGICFSGFAIFWMWQAMGGSLHDHNGGWNWSGIVFSLFGLPFFFVGLLPMGLGFLSFFPSHGEIVVTSSELIAVDFMGPVRFRRRKSIGDIRKLRVGRVFEKSQNGAASPTETDGTNHGIFAEVEGASSNLRLVQRYPEETLLPVAEFLLGELKTRGHALELMARTPQPPVGELSLTVDKDPVVEGASAEQVAEPPPTQPDGSRIVFVPAADGVTFMVPRSGFKGAGKALVLMSLFWNGMSGIFFVVILVQLIHEPSWENLGILGFISLFVAIGVGLILGGVQLVFRKAVLLATRESLVFSQTGPVRKSEFVWLSEHLTAIRCANSNTSVNNQPLKELLINSKDKQNPRRGLLTGRDAAELEWMAGTLRSFYRLKG